MALQGLGAGQLLQPGLYPAPQPAEPLADAGTSFGEFIGWRIWGVSHGYLTSYSADYAWLPGHPTEGDVSDHGYGGIWAFKDRHRAFKKALESVGSTLVEGWAAGSVWMYGEIVEHTLGYRSQYAVVRSIDELLANERQSWKDWATKREARRAAKLMLNELRERYITSLSV
jgi:hypothetical protein